MQYVHGYKMSGINLERNMKADRLPQREKTDILFL